MSCFTDQPIPSAGAVGDLCGSLILVQKVIHLSTTFWNSPQWVSQGTHRDWPTCPHQTSTGLNNALVTRIRSQQFPTTPNRAQLYAMQHLVAAYSIL